MKEVPEVGGDLGLIHGIGGWVRPGGKTVSQRNGMGQIVHRTRKIPRISEMVVQEHHSPSYPAYSLPVSLRKVQECTEDDQIYGSPWGANTQ